MRDVRDPIIRRIEDLVKDVPGWSPVDQLYTLFCLVHLNPDLEGDIVEIGSWCGRSTAVLGLAARLTGKDVGIIAVDLFPGRNDWRRNADGSYSFEVTIGGRTYGAYKDQTVWKEPFERDIAPIYETHDGVYEVFMETVARNGIRDIVTPVRGSSDMLASVVSPSFKCRLAFIDGDHSYEAVCRDIANIAPYLVDGGWICFDDAFSCYEGVDRAITERIIDDPAFEACRQMTRKLFVARKRASPAGGGGFGRGGRGTLRR